jgi:hypothetical protein
VITNDIHILALLTCQFFDSPGVPVGDLWVKAVNKYTVPAQGGKRARDYFGIRKNPAQQVDEGLVGRPLPNVSAAGSPPKYQVLQSEMTAMSLNYAAGAILMLYANGVKREKQARLGLGPPGNIKNVRVWEWAHDRPVWFWISEGGETAFGMAANSARTCPGLLITYAAAKWAMLGDGSDKSTLWARSKNGAAPQQLSWSAGVSGTPSYVIVRQL